jgi:hypothetical protein
MSPKMASVLITVHKNGFAKFVENSWRAVLKVDSLPMNGDIEKIHSVVINLRTCKV